MNQTTDTGLRWTFWLIAVLALLWYAMTALNFFIQMDPEVLAKMPESHRLIVEGRPVWATFGFALAAVAGVMGCVALLLRKAIAIRLFVISFVGVCVTMIHTIIVAFSKGAFSGSDIMMMIIAPILVALLLIVFAMRGRNRGWIR